MKRIRVNFSRTDLLVHYRSVLLKDRGCKVSDIVKDPFWPGGSPTDGMLFTADTVPADIEAQIAGTTHIICRNAKDGDPEPIYKFDGKPAPAPPAEWSTESLGFLTKNELETLGRKHGVELDKRSKKEDLITEVLTAIG